MKILFGIFFIVIGAFMLSSAVALWYDPSWQSTIATMLIGHMFLVGVVSIGVACKAFHLTLKG